MGKTPAHNKRKFFFKMPDPIAHEALKKNTQKARKMLKTYLNG